MARRVSPLFGGYGAMTRLGRYWLFFVIVAVGLALSWGQVGRKAQRVLEAEPVTYLAVEPGCYADRQPCAASTGDHALVLGPAQTGLRLKQTGLPHGEIVAVEASVLEAAVPVVREADSWQILAPARPAGPVRVRIVGNGRVTVADFPVHAAAPDSQ